MSGFKGERGNGKGERGETKTIHPLGLATKKIFHPCGTLRERFVSRGSRGGQLRGRVSRLEQTVREEEEKESATMKMG